MKRYSFQFSIRVLLALTLLCCVLLVWLSRPKHVAPPAELWRELLLQNSEPLTNIPRVRVLKKGSLVAITNSGSTTLEFDVGSTGIQQFIEKLDGQAWTVSAYEPNAGATKDLKPGQTLEFEIEFLNGLDHERVLAMFSEKSTPRRGLVVLAEEPKD